MTQLTAFLAPIHHNCPYNQFLPPFPDSEHHIIAYSRIPQTPRFFVPLLGPKQEEAAVLSRASTAQCLFGDRERMRQIQVWEEEMHMTLRIHATRAALCGQHASAPGPVYRWGLYRRRSSCFSMSLTLERGKVGGSLHFIIVAHLPFWPLYFWASCLCLLLTVQYSSEQGFPWGLKKWNVFFYYSVVIRF